MTTETPFKNKQTISYLVDGGKWSFPVDQDITHFVFLKNQQEEEPFVIRKFGNGIVYIERTSENKDPKWINTNSIDRVSIYDCGNIRPLTLDMTDLE